MGEDFPRAFDEADVVVLTEIYAAGEAPIPGVTAEKMFRPLLEDRERKVLFVPKREDIAPRLMEVVRPDDMVIVLGAGDISRTADEMCRFLEGGGAGE